MRFTRICLLLLLSGSQAADAASIPGGRDAWQKLLKMPSVHLEFSAGLSEDNGIELSNDRPDPAVEIPKLRAQLRGTPGDAALYWEMSCIYSRVDDDKNRSNILARAVALLRARAEAQPEDVDVLSRFGLALAFDGKSEEAGAVLRRAVRIGPEDWRGWAALGKWHIRAAWRSFAELTPTNNQKFMEFALDKAAKRELPARLLEAAEKGIVEAERCADRAVESAPNEPLAYNTRVGVRSNRSLLDYLGAVARGADPDPLMFQLAVFPTNALADVWRAAELSPHDPRPLGLATLGQFIISAGSLSKADRDSIAEGNLPRLAPNDELRPCISALTRLKEIGETGPQATAALALEIRGLLLFVFLQDYRGAEASLRRAIELDPARETSWDTLTGMLSMRDRDAEARTMAEKRLKLKDTSRNRVIAAKTCEHLLQLTEAQAHVDQALKLEPDGYLPNISAAVLLLKRSKTAESAALALPAIKKVEKLATDSTDSIQSITRDQKIEFTLTVGIFYVLVDQPSMARPSFQKVLAADKDNETAKEALSMLAGK